MNVKKKIGIISCDGWLRLWDNYGTLFQNYALQTHLQKLGYDTYWIQTGSEPLTLKRILGTLLSNPKKVLNAIRTRLIGCFCGQKKKSEISEFNSKHPRYFGDFLEKYVPRTKIAYSQSRLQDNPPEAFAYIVGSDQVWGSVLTSTFLDFGAPNALRIAYAVSTAWKTRNSEWLSDAKKKISKFNAVSVREPEGIEICKQVGRNDAVHVVDPTLLLTREDYMRVVRLEGEDKSFSQKTVLAYFLNVTSKESLPWSQTVEFARGRNATLKVVPLQGAELAIPEEFVFTPNPAEWLNAYDKADCVVTNSFHGTAFAIIMRKPFLVLLQKGKTEAENCRFLSILKRIGLESRIFVQDGSPMEQQMSEPIEWDVVARKLNAWREESMCFLSNVFAVAPKSASSLI